MWNICVSEMKVWWKEEFQSSLHVTWKCHADSISYKVWEPLHSELPNNEQVHSSITKEAV